MKIKSTTFLIKTALIYGLIGALMGSFLFALTMPILIVPVMFIGLFIGFTPAFLTGLILLLLNTQKGTIKSYAMMLVVGALVSLLFGLGIEWTVGNMAKSSGMDWRRAIQLPLVLAMIGAISSLITGLMVLPKDHHTL